MLLLRIFITIIISLSSLSFTYAKPVSRPDSWSHNLALKLCRGENSSPEQIKDILNQAPSGLKSIKILLQKKRFFAATATLNNATRVDINIRFIAQPNQQIRVSTFVKPKGISTKPEAKLLVDLAADCSMNRAVFLEYKKDGRLHALHHYSQDLQKPDRTEYLNPAVPSGQDPGGVAVAHYDTGVNYQLKFISSKLARSSNGEILGYDFKDNDRQPFDLDPSFPAFLPRRHGTAVISILLREAPNARIISFRHPGKDISRFDEIIEATAKTPARIVAMPLGGYKAHQWQSFSQASKKHKNILFIISAGNDGRDIDKTPVYPASFTHDNFLVVTSVDAFGRFPVESNWGVSSVDIAVPAERIDVIDHRGAKGKASGSSYAVPRVAALAARLAEKHPAWSASEIKQAITKLAGPRPGADKKTKFGWIALPDQEGY